MNNKKQKLPIVGKTLFVVLAALFVFLELQSAKDKFFASSQGNGVTAESAASPGQSSRPQTPQPSPETESGSASSPAPASSPSENSASTAQPKIADTGGTATANPDNTGTGEASSNPDTDKTGAASANANTGSAGEASPAAGTGEASPSPGPDTGVSGNLAAASSPSSKSTGTSPAAQPPPSGAASGQMLPSALPTDPGSYVVPDSGTVYLSQEEINSINPDLLRFARNEIFARHGYMFKRKVYREYFTAKSWYVPDPSYPGDFSVLSWDEASNVLRIKALEKRLFGN
ncbi:MAG: YARHG domain-containing protein [Firmicutes bacterium]|nr:YARHG domain-containing protein [Bacillota bacterium]